ncbi:polyphosphate kinase 2 family protein [Hymenobacter sp. HMF4947]|uniref:Polyphosphate kinase 2 family protein n=1 Tax=Hymenobacter ginkgonis TaxID=2682976 RepID=A0A7K1TG09_9BACT|nr:polyphosphate kinase 2 family protein [Hymenobacter ginkgonis]MVN77344.1 polyphosphate kinase 2 family protein [Hymenobacter ginkgonis]
MTATSAAPLTPAVRVQPGTPFRLADIDPANTEPFPLKKKLDKRLEELREQLSDYQENLYAEHRQSLLLVFQAIDTGGKDGTIRNLLTGVNPAGVEVTSFKTPSSEELNHDFLWRIHPHTPGRGHIGVFNRSHYEDVLVTRVHGLIEPHTWQQRYQDITNFEQLLTRNGTRVLKFFLHISKDEQARRLQARLDNPKKRWKFEPGDLVERKLWDAYQVAFQEALAATATPECPWYVIPANNKRARDLAIAEIVVAALADMNPQPPAATFDVAAQVIE